MIEVHNEKIKTFPRLVDWRGIFTFSSSLVVDFDTAQIHYTLSTSGLNLELRCE